MSRKELLSRVYAEQIVGVVREDSAEVAEAVAEAYARNGIRIVEITMTTPDAIELMGAIAQKYGPQVAVAAGTVRSTNDAGLARRAGATIIVSPHTDVHVIEYANENELLPGYTIELASPARPPRPRSSARGKPAATSSRSTPPITSAARTTSAPSAAPSATCRCSPAAPCPST